MRLSSAYVLAHLGLGDNVCMIGCLHFLANFYDDVYFLCKDNYSEQLKFALNDWPFLHIVSIDASCEEESCKSVLIDKYQDSDIFICGWFHTHYLKSKITHPFLRDPSMLLRIHPSGFRSFMRESYQNCFSNIKDDYFFPYKGYCNLPNTFNFIDMFYRDIGLNTSISSDFFMVSKNTMELSHGSDDNCKLKNYKIVFVNSSCGMNDKVFDFSCILNPYLQDDKYIVLCSNQNYYSSDNLRYEVAQKYVLLPTIFHYISIIQKAEVIWLSDSCISCITINLIKQGKILTNDVHIINRFSMTETDLSMFYHINE
jgi:hypothetical protein